MIGSNPTAPAAYAPPGHKSQGAVIHRNRSLSGWRKAILWTIGVFVGLAILGSILPHAPDSTKRKRQVPSPTEKPAASSAYGPIAAPDGTTYNPESDTHRRAAVKTLFQRLVRQEMTKAVSIDFAQYSADDYSPLPGEEGYIVRTYGDGQTAAGKRIRVHYVCTARRVGPDVWDTRVEFLDTENL